MARSQKAEQLLRAMRQLDLIDLQEISVDEAMSMHGHMLDFKKRGAFIRLGWRASVGKPVPDYGYCPSSIPLPRKLVETVITLSFYLCGTRLARRMIEFVPIGLLGPVFDLSRRAWKSISKPTKRRGLRDLAFDIYGGQGGGSACDGQSLPEKAPC